MKKAFLLMVLTVLATFGVQAKEKQVTLTFDDDAKNGITWDAALNSFSGSKLTFCGSWSASGWKFSKPVNVKGFKFASADRDTELTFEFRDSDNKVGCYHFWGPDPLGEVVFDMVALANADEKPNLEKITSIMFNPRAGEAGCYVDFGTITLTIDADEEGAGEEEGGEGEGGTEGQYDALFPLTDGALDINIWNMGESNAYDAATKTLTLGNDGNAAGWTFEATDISAYEKLVIELQEPLGFWPQIRFRNATPKATGQDVHYVGLPSDATKIEIDLTAEQFEYDGGNGAKVALDLTDINAVYFWAWAGRRDIKLEKVYLVAKEGPATGMTAVKTANADGRTYNLKGQTVGRSGNKGIYIVNGKKVVK